MKPIIGISAATMTSPRSGREHGRIYLERDYADRVIEAGGVPILIPPGADFVYLGPILDGLIIPGGNDIDASNWGEENHPEVTIENPERTNTELGIFDHLRPEVPVLGICYGCQLLNVHLGGSLIQHLPDVVGEDYHRGDPIQNYRIEPDTRLAGILGDSAQGKSWHHQAVDKTGENLRVSAWHEDGTVEAIESTSGRWFVGVQWHPERTEGEDSEKLFSAFIQAVLDAKAARMVSSR
ncbi:MAG: gamma-glutamyl-gamma-aminobutyrate hydrolase family protein [Fimbriimonadaceae bacterium]|nr:gamma-glutamyl-gamma-aminobutyrate hydrolase family protein [Fimbriimonadaceae bacterium]